VVLDIVHLSSSLLHRWWCNGEVAGDGCDVSRPSVLVLDIVYLIVNNC
jgi:hypothetical protein